MNRFLLVLATLAMLTTAALPSFADGNPWPRPTGPGQPTGKPPVQLIS